MSAIRLPYVVVGVNHRTAPVEVRERLAIPSSELAISLQAAARQCGVQGLVLLSTCNRVEVIGLEPLCEPSAVRFLCGRTGIAEPELRDHVYVKTMAEAVLHIFRVASSMDSMIVGEAQILGQLKQAVGVARESGTLSPELDLLMTRAFAVAKRVRTETSIGSSSVSIASAAVDLSKKIFGSLQGRTVLLVGAGKMTELALRHLRANGAGDLLVVNRSFDRAETLARKYQGRALTFESLNDAAPLADIVITSTGSEQPIIRTAQVQAFLQKRKNRPMFFVDIAVPRDVEGSVNRVDGAFVYDIDDLQQVVCANLVDRSREAERAEAILQEDLLKFESRLHELHVVPTIVSLQDAMESMRQSEIDRVRGRLGQLTQEQEAAIESLTRGIVNKVLHTPITALKTAAKAQDAEVLVEHTERLFGIKRSAKERAKA